MEEKRAKKGDARKRIQNVSNWRANQLVQKNSSNDFVRFLYI